jgi:hypothetical protein
MVVNYSYFMKLDLKLASSRIKYFYHRIKNLGKIREIDRVQILEIDFIKGCLHGWDTCTFFRELFFCGWFLSLLNSNSFTCFTGSIITF